jgi:cytochrome c-type biogenesis protein CcmE
MHPIRKRRLMLISFIVMGVSIAVVLALYALKQNINLYFTPSQIVSGAAPKDHEFRVGGMVRKGSVRHAANSLQVSFVLTDMKKDLAVQYNGILPDLFREGQGIVAQGRLQDGVFTATEVLAKHDEKYMPPLINKENL